MKEKILKFAFIGIVLLIVILLFTIGDHFVHGLEDKWSVPEYYFRNKIPFGYLWAVVGLFLARRFKDIWLKSLVVAGTVAVILQLRYLIEGYPLDFVLWFMLFHFLILYVLVVGMFWLFNKLTIKI